MILIIGPCVIAEDTLEIAARVKGIVELFKWDKFYFKASFDKANRTSHLNYRGPGLHRGLMVLDDVRRVVGLQTTTDVHEVWQARPVADVVDMVQIPALLCRQTDLIQASARFAKVLNIKKGQFSAPWDIQFAVEKAEAEGCKTIYVTERGTSFGYNRLVVDMLSFPVMRQMGLTAIFDCTHSLQLPGAGCGCSAGSTEYVIPLAKAAMGAGAQGLFMEVCLSRETAKCDGSNSVLVDELAEVLMQLLPFNTLAGNT